MPDNTVLVAVDFSPCSAAALRRATRIARWRNARLSVLHVVEAAVGAVPDPLIPMDLAIALPVQKELVAEAHRRWSIFAKACGGCAAQLTIEVGNPRDRILEAVRRDRPGLLVMGAHSTSDASREIGTTAAACAQWAAAPVLIVREEQTGPFRAVGAGLGGGGAPGAA